MKTHLVLSLSIVALVTLSTGAQTTRASRQLALGVMLSESGQHASAVSALQTAVAADDLSPSDRARAHLYLGMSLLEIGESAEARLSFAAARELDPTVEPTPTEFPARVVDAYHAVTSEPTEANDAETARERDPTLADWLREETDGLVVQVVRATEERSCAGTVRVLTSQAVMVWRPSPDDTSSLCGPESRVPFVGIGPVSGSAAGGVQVVVPTGEDGRWVFVPRPFGGWFENGWLGRRWLNEPPELAVAVRVLVRQLNDALGRREWTNGSFYGTAIQVSMEDLRASPGDYDGRPVVTEGPLRRLGRGPDARFELRSQSGVLGISPEIGIEMVFRARAGGLNGENVIVIGIFEAIGPGGRDAADHVVRFWDFLGDEPRAVAHPTQTLAQLMAGAPPEGEVVVVGRYRAHNLWADLPLESSARRSPVEDWVLSHGESALWVVGESPSGSGWDLFPSRQDFRYGATWLSVRGRLERRDGMTVLQASDVTPVRRPAATEPGTSGGQAGFQGVPAIQFTFPASGTTVERDQQFRVQFTKHMRADTFGGRVALRYGGDDRDLEHVRLEYLLGTRELQIDPGEALQPERTLELFLRPGIEDFTGRTMETDPDRPLLEWNVRR